MTAAMAYLALARRRHQHQHGGKAQHGGNGAYGGKLAYNGGSGAAQARINGGWQVAPGGSGGVTLSCMA